MPQGAMPLNCYVSNHYIYISQGPPLTVQVLSVQIISPEVWIALESSGVVAKFSMRRLKSGPVQSEH